jgi:hypothetical protein
VVIKLQTIAIETYMLNTLFSYLENMLKMDKLRSLEKTHMLMIGGLAVVAGIVLFLIVSQHGPAICSNASFCG